MASPYTLGKRVALISMGTCAFLAVAKIVVGLMAGSTAVVADGVESASDIVASSVVLFGLVIAAKPPDADHPYGHGRMETLMGGAVGMMLSTTGVIICVRSLAKLSEAGPPPAAYAIWPLLVSIAFKGALSPVKFHYGHQVRSSALVADAWNDLVDVLSGLTALAGLGLTLYDPRRFAAADHYGGFAVGLIVIFLGLRVIRDTAIQLMDTMPGPAKMEDIRRVALAVPGVMGVEKCFARNTGFKHHVDLHLEVDPAMTVRASHEIATQVREKVVRELDWVADVLVHVEPHQPLLAVEKPDGKQRNRAPARGNRRSDGDRRRGFVPHPQLPQRRLRHRGLPRAHRRYSAKTPRATSPRFPASAKGWPPCFRRSRNAAPASGATSCWRNIPPTALEFLKIQGLGPKSIAPHLGALPRQHHRRSGAPLPRTETARAAAHGRQAGRESAALHRPVPAELGPLPAELRRGGRRRADRLPGRGAGNRSRDPGGQPAARARRRWAISTCWSPDPEPPTPSSASWRIRRVTEVLGKGANKASAKVGGEGLQVDVRALPPESFGAALQYFTGSKEHNVALRTRAREDGPEAQRVRPVPRRGREARSPGRPRRASTRPWAWPGFRPSCARTGARSKPPPRAACRDLVELSDIRGDLHMHTTETDGRATLEEMAEAAKALGYEYIAITDHSKALAMANGLDEKRVIDVRGARARAGPGTHSASASSPASSATSARTAPWTWRTTRWPSSIW